jgi:MFS family permease
MTSAGRLSDPKWLALWAAMLGYLLDAMDVLLYVFAIQVLKDEFHMSNATAGMISSAGLICSAAGGIIGGWFCDRFGRTRTLIYTILVYSIGSGGSATAQSIGQLMFWRAVVGLGLGAEWSAGATLVSEFWPPQHRGKAIAFMQSGWALGYMAAAVASGLILPRFGWRALFLIGVLPALITVFIRRRVPEPEIWQASKPAPMADIFRAPLARITALTTMLATVVLFGYWGLFTWLPGFLSAPLIQGGAGLNILKTSAWVFLMQGGAFAGYLLFGFLSDRWGRRPAFRFYCLMAALVVPIYGFAPQWAGNSAEGWLLAIGPAVGFFGTGYFSLFGSMLAELYPTRSRGAGLGFAYNVGRGVAALAPFAVGALGDRYGLGPALALSSGFYLAGALLVYLLPETRNAALE